MKMLENLYTTKMSANKKILQNRFTKIRSKSGRFSKMMVLVVFAVISVTFVFANVVMAVMDKQESEQVEDKTKEAEQINIEDKTRETGAAHSLQSIEPISLNQQNDNSSSLQQPNSDNRDDTGNIPKEKIQSTEFENASPNTDANFGDSDIEQPVSDTRNIKSSFVSDELYCGFEQIVLTNTDYVQLQEELEKKGLTQSYGTSVDLQKNYAVKDNLSDKTQVSSDENGNISIYISVDNDNLFDIQITDSETNEDVGQYTILANNNNVYSFLGFEKGKSYNVEIQSKTQGDWNIKGNYIIY